jgi:hypothetical protein
MDVEIFKHTVLIKNWSTERWIKFEYIDGLYVTIKKLHSFSQKQICVSFSNQSERPWSHDDAIVQPISPGDYPFYNQQRL